jgi:ribonuclease PH
MRSNNRKNNQMRNISVERNFTKHAHGSVLISYGDTKVLCTAFLEDRVPHFLRDSGRGWVTAEYSLLPSATNTRYMREVNKGKPSGRTQEIQRLIGRSLRAVIDMEALGERTISIDADVIQADGGTRTAAITGCIIALHDAITNAIENKVIKNNPLKELLAAVSVGVLNDEVICDLNYEEDSQAEVDMNIIMTESGKFVEVQGTAEEQPFSKDTLNQMLSVAEETISEIICSVKEILKT